MIQVPVTPRIPPIIAPQTGLTATLSGGVLTIAFSNLTAQVHSAAIAYFAVIPNASWSNFLAGYVGDRDATDGSYQATFVSPVAPIGGQLWLLLQGYLLSIGRTPARVPLDLAAIWAAAPNMPL